MTDTDKVKLINHIVADAMEFGDCGCSNYVNGILAAIGSVCDYEEIKTNAGN